MKLIKNNSYLLLIDEEAGIDINNYIVAKDLSGVAKVKEYKKGHILAIEIFQNTELGISYHQTSDWNKIIAYYPLKEAKELDLPLLPNPFEEIDIEKLAKEYIGMNPDKEWDSDEDYYNPKNREYYSFIDGYKAAQSDKQFSLEDMKKAIEMAREGKTCIGGGSDYVEDGEADDCVDWYHTEKQIIQSLSTQQIPKEFIPEYNIHMEAMEMPRIHIQKAVKTLKTITNSEGKEEIQGTYKY